jgi:hypothetical protein
MIIIKRALNYLVDFFFDMYVAERSLEANVQYLCKLNGDYCCPRLPSSIRDFDDAIPRYVLVINIVIDQVTDKLL